MTVDIFESLGLSVRISDPLWFPERQYYGQFMRELTGWEHVINADGGYGSARFGFLGEPLWLEMWAERGLGCHVEAYSPRLDKIGEYFVNSVTLSISGYSITVGPLLNVSNRVKVLYTPYLDLGVDPPTTGTQTETTYGQDLTSQAKFGIQEAMISGGTMIDDLTITGLPVYNQAEELRDTFLADYAYPKADRQELSLPAITGDGVTLECLGYDAWLDEYEYVNAAIGTTTIRQKIIAVLAAQPNGLFSAETAYMDANPGLAAVQDSGRTARTVLNELRDQGDGAARRMTLGFYNDRTCYYQAVTNEIAYYYHLYTTPNRITTLGGVAVDPWEIRPARWLFFPDFMLGRIPVSSTPSQAGTRFMFIESVRFTAPYGVSLSGIQLAKSNQLMARMSVL